MTISDTYDFLLRASIPRVTERTKLPEDLRWTNGHKIEKESEPEYSDKKLIWECICRAHRDVLSGRDNVTDYSSNTDSGFNKVSLELYYAITRADKRINPKSRDLIEHLLPCNNGHIGSTQKLVNMALKYMYLMQLFGKLSDFNINENDCDCPLDSIILERLGRNNNKWTKDFKINDGDDGYSIYVEIQNQIQRERGEKSRLSYDFENWQSF